MTGMKTRTTAVPDHIPDEGIRVVDFAFFSRSTFSLNHCRAPENKRMIVIGQI